MSPGADRSFIYIGEQKPHKLDIETDQESAKENESPVDTDLRSPPVAKNDRLALRPIENSGYVPEIAEPNPEEYMELRKRAIPGIYGYLYRTPWREENDIPFLRDLSELWNCHLAKHQTSLDGNRELKLASQAFDVWLEEQKIRVLIKDHPNDQSVEATLHKLKVLMVTEHRDILRGYVSLVALALEWIVGVHDLLKSFESALLCGGSEEIFSSATSLYNTYF